MADTAAEPAASVAGVDFAVSELIQQSLTALQTARAQLTEADAKELDRVITATAAQSTISLLQIQWLSKTRRSLPDALSSSVLYVHDFLSSTSLCPVTPAVAASTRNPLFTAHLQQLRINQEARAYQQMMNQHKWETQGKSIFSSGQNINSISAVNSNKTSAANDLKMSGSIAEASKEIGVGVNMIVMMITGFAICYYIGLQLFPHSQLLPIATGTVGLIAALMMEVTLFIIRDAQADKLRDKQMKAAAARAGISLSN